MIAIRYPLVLQRVSRERITLEAAAACVGLHPLLIERFVDFGLLEPAERTGAEVCFDAACLPRLAAISRLRQDLGVNLHGIAVIFELLDRLAALRREVEALRPLRRDQR